MTDPNSRRVPVPGEAVYGTNVIDGRRVAVPGEPVYDPVIEGRRAAVPGEPVYDTVIDPVTGQRVSAKPANAAIIAGQKARLEREREVAAAKEEKAAAAASQAATSRTQQQQPRQRPHPRQGGGGNTSRITSALLLALFVPLLSMFLTGKSYTFGVADGLRPALRNIWRSTPFYHEQRFTLTQLAQYDGSNPDKPLYLAVDGVVFDVSANPRIYGQGGSYNFMTGRDASRAFITGCFETHRTHDLRGLTIDQLKSLDTWKDFFDNSDKYFRVGRVDLPPIEEGSPIPPDCHVDAEQADAHKHVQGKVPKGDAQTAHQHGAKKPGKKDPHDGTSAFKVKAEGKRGDDAKGHGHHGHHH